MSVEPPLVKKRVDFALVKNEDLRPWTVNPELDKRLHHEMDALERTITYIAPQMNAGNLGCSVLDGNVPGVKDFQNTIKTTVSQRKSITKLDPMNEFFPLYVAKSRLNLRNSNAGSKHSSKAPSKPSTNTFNFTQQFHLEDNHNEPQTSTPAMIIKATGSRPFGRMSSAELENSVIDFDYQRQCCGLESRDLQHISFLQQSIFEEYRAKRSSRPPSGSIRSVAFRSASIPAVLPISRSEYNQLKADMKLTSSLPSITGYIKSNSGNGNSRGLLKHHSAGSLPPQRLQALVTRSGTFGNNK